MDYDEYCDELEVEGARFVALCSRANESAMVPSCPEWSVTQLLAHVGFVHRWARHLVDVRARERISARDMNLSRGPVSPAWISEGVADVLSTLRASDPHDVMWAWGADQHVAFWARRLLHETLVHRVDLEQSLGAASEIDQLIAVDGIDEFLANLERAGDFSPNVKNLVGSGEIITFRVDEGAAWSVRLLSHGFEFIEAGADADAVLSGPASQILLVLYRRLSLEESSCVLNGDADLAETWLANIALL